MVTSHQYTGRTSYLLAQYGTGLPSYTNIGLQYAWPHGCKLAGANNVPGHTASTQTNGQQLPGLTVLHRRRPKQIYHSTNEQPSNRRHCLTSTGFPHIVDIRYARNRSRDYSTSQAVTTLMTHWVIEGQRLTSIHLTATDRKKIIRRANTRGAT